VFIRAPQIVACDPGVTVLAEYGGLPVAVAHGHHLTTTFHPELAESDALHLHFIALCRGEPAAAASPAARARA
jgi:pyridoxal 5'-phosphate synthase pdxT subunit